MIGLDNYKLIAPLSIREGKSDEPTATKTRLGWVVCGTNRDVNSTNTEYNFHVCECSQTDESLHDLVKQHYTLDNLGVAATESVVMSKDDVRALELLETTTSRVGKRYQTGLLWKYDEVEFPDSRPMALRRLECLERKMSRDEPLATELKRQIAEYVDNGYARKLEGDELKASKRTWYLPIFAVRNPNKPEKIRMVWDAAATVGTVSLNSMLLKGPELLTPLVSVLFGFRERKIAITGDIRHMFHQVAIIPEDQDSQRFLWRDGEADRPPDVWTLFGSFREKPKRAKVLRHQTQSCNRHHTVSLCRRLD